MAWIAQVLPSPRHPKPRWQVRYQDCNRERSAGIYHSPKAADTVRKRFSRGLPPTLEGVPVDVQDASKAETLFGDYVTRVWWPTWKAQHPDSAYCVGKRIEKRILPTFGNTRRSQEPAHGATRGLDHPIPARPPRRGDPVALPRSGQPGSADRAALGGAGRAALGRRAAGPAAGRRCCRRAWTPACAAGAE
jgi:hypothetical protein